jgi:4'-phosphopantetheinyl transferase
VQIARTPDILISPWARAAAPPALGASEVHAWCVDLDAPGADGGAEAGGLSADERTRAARFHFARNRARFLRGRAALRHLLAGYAGREPHALVFVPGTHGKPALPGTGLEFNLSHSGGCAVLAVTRGRRVGVDVERIRAERATLAVARRFFAPAEAAAVATAAPAERALTFFRCWTRKEAYVKARGEGLSLPLDRFEVPLEPHATAALTVARDDHAEAARWSLRELVPAPHHLAALVVEGQGWTLRAWTWEHSDEPLDSAPAARYP